MKIISITKNKIKHEQASIEQDQKRTAQMQLVIVQRQSHTQNAMQMYDKYQEQTTHANQHCEILQFFNIRSTLKIDNVQNHH